MTVITIPNTKWQVGSKVMVGRPAHQTVQNEGPQAISEIVHMEYHIVCCIEKYLIHIYHMSKCN